MLLACNCSENSLIYGKIYRCTITDNNIFIDNNSYNKDDFIIIECVGFEDIDTDSLFVIDSKYYNEIETFIYYGEIDNFKVYRSKDWVDIADIDEPDYTYEYDFLLVKDNVLYTIEGLYIDEAFNPDIIKYLKSIDYIERIVEYDSYAQGSYLVTIEEQHTNK